MLVLSRKVGERVVIGNQVVLTVVEVGGDRIKLGIEAPREVPIHREEIYRQLRHEEWMPVASPLDESNLCVQCG